MSTNLTIFNAPAGQALPIEAEGRSVIQGVTPGCFHLDISADEYHSLPDSVSCSGLKHILRSPAHFQAYLERDDDKKPNLGTALHCAALEPHVFQDKYTFFSGDRRGKVYEAFVEENPGKTVLTEVEWIKVAGMMRSLLSFSEFPLRKALKLAQREMSIFWTDEETGVRCRVRLDAFNSPFNIFDLKSTTDARPEYFIKQAVRLDYDLQAAMYTEAVRQYIGERVPFVFVAVEEDSPNGVWLMPAGESMLENGMKKFRSALATYARCKASGEWPGYTNAMSVLEWPRHAQLKD